MIYKVANHQPAPFNVSTDSCNCRKFLFHFPLFFFLLSIGFFASFGMSHTLLKRTMPSILFSEHSVCILRSEIFHLVAASCTVIYSNITDLHIISMVYYTRSNEQNQETNCDQHHPKEQRQGFLPADFGLCVNNFCVDDFSCPCLYLVHSSNTQHRVFCFELFGHTSALALFFFLYIYKDLF